MYDKFIGGCIPNFVDYCIFYFYLFIPYKLHVKYDNALVLDIQHFLFEYSVGNFAFNKLVLALQGRKFGTSVL